MAKAVIALNMQNRRYEQRQWTMLIMNGLRAKIFEQKVSMKDISARTNLSVHTISKMMHGETRYPRHNTVIALLKYLGYKLYAEI